MAENKGNINKLEEKNTKERIFESAIDLFAQKGFDATSMREIAEAVGIKKASLYSHYKSKNEIMDNIFEYFKKELIKMRPPEAQNLDKIDKVTPEIFRQRANLTLYIFKNPVMEKIFRIISSEQYKDKRARMIVLECLIHEPYSFSRAVLEIMVKKGIINKIDPDIKAMEFQYTIFTLFMEYLLLKSDNSNTGKIGEMIEKHLDYFVKSLEKK
ncbi:MULTISPECIES: TetR/AcrR family transcriptional regulator [Methanobacterium]|uniref:TetR/AcrR family transcriptional regulator n=1 Tax=Methanobacterium veterum TaxID=408577 RepID=A0A9E5A913_9EURY|nr:MULTISPECIES: TetR/AcrR family transcriptional regulator [Methanobacterium]MCZ3367005.1 TetR/AcrR family transcriptional regulator [Methanobacterium veterum]MCZ3373848.1 TetR/AcrR family transcriptional regulator [Methanobacterium veterum]